MMMPLWQLAAVMPVPADPTFGLSEHIGAILVILGVIFGLFVTVIGAMWRQNNQNHRDQLNNVKDTVTVEFHEISSRLDRVQIGIQSWQERDEREHEDFRRLFSDHEARISYLQGRLGMTRRANDITTKDLADIP